MKDIAKPISAVKIAGSPEQLLQWIKTDHAYLEGLSYALPDEAGRQMRRRLANMYKEVKRFLFKDTDTGEDNE